PALGMTRPGLDVGGPLKEDATVKRGGILSFLNRSRIYVNGRELASTEAQWLAPVLMSGGGMLWAGQYLVDCQRQFRKDGKPASTNLFQLIAAMQTQMMLQQMAGGGGGQGYQRQTAGGYIGSDGQSSYFFDPETGSSVMSGG